jgi:hypothetical protein
MTGGMIRSDEKTTKWWRDEGIRVEEKIEVEEDGIGR